MVSGVQVKAQFRPGESTSHSVARGAVKSGGNANGFSVTYSGVGYIGIESALDNNTVPRAGHSVHARATKSLSRRRR